MKRGLVLASLLSFAMVAAISCSSSSNESGGTTVTPNTNLDWRDQVIYQAITDRFADSDPNNNWNVDRSTLEKYQNNDWKSLADKAPYLKTLGVTAVWIS